MDYLEVQIGIEPREPWSDLLPVELTPLGFDSFLETETGIHAYIPEEHFNKETFDELMLRYSHAFSYRVHITRITGKNWNEEWERNFQPITIGDRLLVRAPFHPGGSNQFREEIVIQPKMSFGTGHHDTTYLMLEYLLDYSLELKRVADIGCGTGILAIMAAKKGASEVLAVDIEEIAVENTLENCALNGVFGIIVEKGGEDKLQGRSFHVILANINRNVLISHMKAYSESLENGGDLMLSGFFTTDADLLLKQGQAYGLKEIGRRSRNGWCMLHLRKDV